MGSKEKIEKAPARKSKWIKYFFEMVFIVAVFMAFTWWQHRGLLEVNEDFAPDFALNTLQGEVVHLSQLRGKKVLLYFFAPWCTVCRLSADNLNDLRAARSQNELMVLMVGLSWENVNELKDFVAELDLQVPVLVGYDQQMIDYKIKGFPTYYVIDEAGVIQSRSMGYSTEIGMRIRTWD